MSIEKLSDDIINQIAAGEVIENPAAVIKELIENSIDAGADTIEVEIENSGLDLIKIKDNGLGIAKQDLLKAPLRHATSKIKTFNDLYNINTMGFRGEALASIFSIAKTKIISKPKTQQKAYEISSEDISQVKESAIEVGTLIEVKDLFYNTPARKKYLKSPSIELKNILDTLTRYLIIYPEKKITLKHNQKILINKPKFSNWEDNLVYILGLELKNNLIHFENEIQGLKVSGFIANPSEITYSFKKNQYLYVNKRFVKSKLISDAIYQGFGSNLMVGRHPFYVLNIEIDPEIIDVNIHPTKIELRFENQTQIFNFIQETISKIFEKNPLFKEFEKKEYDLSLDKKIENLEITQSEKKPSSSNTKTYFTKESQKSFEIKPETFQTEIKWQPKLKEKEIEYEKILDTQESPLAETLKEYRILGQLNKTYIVLDTKEGLILVDQHVAEEKYYYEKFKKQYQDKINFGSQKLLKPQIIQLTKSEFLQYRENEKLINSIGFETEVFGTQEILIRAIPINIRKELVCADKLKDFLYSSIVGDQIRCVEEQKYSKLASMACRMSIMAGDELTLPQMKRIIENLKTLKQPFNCPHGRPTFLKYSFYELDKKFKRIV